MERQLWTVDAPVLLVPPRPPLACRTIQLSLPPAGGSGVTVNGLEPRTVEGAVVHNTTVMTPTLRLTGTYDGEALTLTEPPMPGEEGRGFAERRVTPDEAELVPVEPVALQTLRQSLRTDLGDQLLQSSALGGILHLVVAAAAEEQAGQLRARYGPHLVISSWLRPV
ncbi:hypothetical protein EV138_6750 [Kribbella voronezhensis]|uniref:Uncharacterized protein n=2 Tax=Kribbella voronezhensis TaxID=2512212 RepID=A0A4R7SZD2_9ACTN|nr:hypothetical protein EV138_6750 [Kribbella voronezhensis]